MIAIVTDSTVTMTKAEAKALGVCIVPVDYTMSGRRYAQRYRDQNPVFDALINQGPVCCITIQASAETFAVIFNQLLRRNYEVLCICISSRFSGMYNNASIAAKKFKTGKIAVVDSLSTAGGLYLMVKKARILAKQGFPLQQVIAKIENIRQQIGLVFSVDSMEALRSSGRLGVVNQSVSTILNIRPILRIENGAIVSHGFTRGRAEQTRMLINKIPPTVKEIIVHYLGDKSSALPLVLAIKSTFENVELKLCRLGPVLGIHLGLGVIGIAWTCE